MVNFPNLPYRPRPTLGNPRQTWILDSTSSWFRVHCHMNLGSRLDSLKWIADSKAHDSRFHMQKNYFTCGNPDNIFLIQQLDMPMQWKDQALETVSSVTLVKEPQAKEMPMQHSILLQLWKHLLFSSGKLLT